MHVLLNVMIVKGGSATPIAVALNCTPFNSMLKICYIWNGGSLSTLKERQEEATICVTNVMRI